MSRSRRTPTAPGATRAPKKVRAAAGPVPPAAPTTSTPRAVRSAPTAPGPAAASTARAVTQTLEILAPAPGARLSSPLAILRARHGPTTSRTATLRVGEALHIVPIAAPEGGELRENVTLLEGTTRLRLELDGAVAEHDVELAPGRGLTLAAPGAGSASSTRAAEVNGTFEGAACPAGVIAVNGFLQQFAVEGAAGTFAEKVVLRPGANHLAVQVGELYATRLVRGAFPASRLLVTLVWDTPGTDVDLYVIEPDGRSVWYGNKSLSSGGNLDVDRTQGFGPENYSIGQLGVPLRAGRYVVRVHFYADRGVGRTEWTARVLADESSPDEQRRTFYGILETSDSGNQGPGDDGPDWDTVCDIRVSPDGAVTIAAFGAEAR